MYNVLSMDNSKHHTLNKSIAFSPLICLGLIDNISDLLLHHLFLIAKRYIYTCKLNNCNPALQVYIQTVMNSMEIEKEIASNNNNMSSFKNKWALLNFAPRTNKLAVIKKFQKLKVMQKQMQMQSTC